MAATFMFEPGWNLIDFIDNRPGDPKQFDPAWLRPNPIFYGTPNFLIITIETLNSFKFLTSMAATFMFEPDRYLTDFIDNRPGDPKQFDRARPRPIPIFHGTPNFPTIIVEILNSSPIQKSMAATFMFEPGWNLIDFIDKRSLDPKQFDPARLRLNSHFLWNAKLPYNHCWDTIFFSILNLHGGYIYVWAGLKPDCIH